jgi:hypothetical protein
MNIKKFSDYKKYLEIDYNKMVQEVISIPEVKKTIIDLNQKEQLQEGIDAKGQIIETISSKEQNSGYPYARMTVGIRGGAGLQVNKVDMKFTGSFYNTFEVEVRQNEFEVLADIQKGSRSIMDNFESKYDFFGLTKNSLENLAEWLLLTHIKNYIKRHLTR